MKTPIEQQIADLRAGQRTVRALAGGFIVAVLALLVVGAPIAMAGGLDSAGLKSSNVASTLAAGATGSTLTLDKLTFSGNNCSGSTLWQMCDDGTAFHFYVNSTEHFASTHSSGAFSMLGIVRPGGLTSGGLTSGTQGGGGNGNGLLVQGAASTSGSAAAARVVNATALTNDGDAVMDWFSDNASTKVAAIDKDGKFVWPTGGANAITGRTALVGGTVTINTTAVEAASVIHLTRCVTGGTVGHLTVGTVTADTSFVINSSSGTDTSTICWLITN